MFVGNQCHYSGPKLNQKWFTPNEASSRTVWTKWIEEAVSWGCTGENKDKEEGVEGKQTPHWADRFSSSWSVDSTFPSSSDLKYCCWIEKRSEDVSLTGGTRKTMCNYECCMSQLVSHSTVHWNWQVQRMRGSWIKMNTKCVQRLVR